MFTRFTREAREAVEQAEREARSLGAAAVAEEHLLVAVLDRRETRLAADFPGATAERVRAAAGAGDPDREALAAIGISLPEVRRAVEEAFGPGALEGGSRRLPFTRGAKRALELALREALELGARRIDDELVLLGLLREGRARDLLAGLGADPEELRALLRRRRRGRQVA